MLAAETHDLVITSKTREDADADAPDGVAVWVNATTIDKATGGNFQKSTERVAFDDSNGEGVDCDACEPGSPRSDGEKVEGVPTTFEGQIYKFPFGTERQGLRRVGRPHRRGLPGDVRGRGDIQGVDVYKFVQVIEPTDGRAPATSRARSSGPTSRLSRPT